MIDGWGISCGIVLRWKPLDRTDAKWTLVQVMAWCHQATNHYLSQCWLSSFSPYGVTMPQWINTLMPRQNGLHFPVNLLEWKLLNFKYNFTEICSLKSNWQYHSIGLDNSSAPIRQQAIIWANDSLAYWRIYASLGLNDLANVAYNDGY